MTKQIIKLAKETLAYTVEEFAAATGYGRTTIDEAIARGDLRPKFANQKGIILKEEGERWLLSLPDERPAKSA